MNVLVTGGAGYIGSHAVRALQRAGHTPIVLDNLSHGHRAALASSVRFIQGETGDRELLERVLRGEKIEAVMHFAAFIEVGESVTDPGRYYENNFSNALTLLRAMTAAGVAKFVFSSTAAVYGNPVRVPIDEEHPRQPINPYGRSKWMVEQAVDDFRHAHQLGYVILRYFNVAGASPDGDIGEAHEPESHLIPRILATALGQANALGIYGTDYPTKDGTCVRDYVHVEDLARAHVLALEAIRSSQGRIYNLGSQNGFSVREVIEACRRVTGKNFEVREHERRAGDPATLVASSAKIEKELGWKRQYGDLETIIRHAWVWHSTHPQGFATTNPKRD